jgi:hypothetical protein
MRYLKPLFFVSAALIMMGSGTKEVKLTEGTKPGSLAPEIQLQGCSLRCNEYVLLQFWAAYDPGSRVKNILMHNEATRLGLSNLKLVSISFDKSKSVFEETIKADHLITGTQVNDDSGEKSKTFKTYRLDKGFGNVLIDPHGVIVAKNIEADELKTILL